MENILSENPILLLFLVAAVGYLVGKISFKGNSLGVSAVLFVGLAFGASNVEYNVPEIVFQLGLVIYVYSIGLSSGPAFFSSFKRNGLRDIGFVVMMLTLSVLAAIGISYLFDFSTAVTTGLYAGSTTNTPALASVIELVSQSKVTDSSIVQELVLGYTYSYPMGVIGVMLMLKVMEKFFKIDYEEEKKELAKTYPIEEELTTSSVKIINDEVVGMTIRDLKKKYNWNVNFGRISQSEGVSISNYDTILRDNDVIMVIGSRETIQAVTKQLGEEVDCFFYYSKDQYDIRTIFVSNQKIVGKSLSALDITSRYNAIITRIRRGDIEMLAKSNTVLEVGDRIRFVARKEDLDELSNYFGDSYFESSRINLFSFGLGIALGLLLGLIEFTLPGGISFKLGLAGGPLIMGLLLGALKRTGYVVWTLPYSSNVTLRQLGLMMLLAVIGLRSGNTFLNSLDAETGLMIFIGGGILSTLSACISILIGYKLFKIPFSLLLGFLSNQPAILEFGTEMSKNRVPLIGYSLMFPIALVLKVLYAQLLYLIL